MSERPAPWRITCCAVCRRHGEVLYRPGSRPAAAATQTRRTRWTNIGELSVCPRPGCAEVAAPWSDAAPAGSAPRLGPFYDASRENHWRAFHHEEAPVPADTPAWIRPVMRALAAIATRRSRT